MQKNSERKRIVNTTLQVPNSLGDKFFHWDSQNETILLIMRKKAETTLNLSYFEKIMSHWEYI